MTDTSPIQAFSVAPLDRAFAAVITDLDLRDLTADTFPALYRCWLEYALLIFPGQFLGRDEQVDFASRFGTLVPGLEAVEISNVRANGSLRDPDDDDMMKIIRGNMHWHQDDTYQPLQAKGAVFSCLLASEEGGETAFADMRRAWQALTPALRSQVEPLTAKHSLAHSQRVIGEETKADGSEYSGYGLDVATIPQRPLRKVHPETGVPTLAIGRHAYDVEGLDPDASTALLERLTEIAVAEPQGVYTHRWTAGDTILWDNRCLMHRAMPWDLRVPRRMRHSRIQGEPASECALNIALETD